MIATRTRGRRWTPPAILALAAVLATTVSCTGERRPPSVVMILVDTLRSDFLGSYGFDGAISPRMDELAGEGWLFGRCYSAAPWTKPSVASLFTSLNPTSHGVTNHEGGFWGKDDPDLVKGVLRDEASTLAERLGALGYETAAFIANPWISRPYGFGQGFDLYDDTMVDINAPAERVLDPAIAWLSSRPDDRPFFLYLHFMDVHGPYNAPDSLYRLVRDTPGAKSEVRLTPPDLTRIPGTIMASRFVQDTSVFEITTWRARYGAGVRYVDDRLGAFLDRLRDDGTLDRAYVVFISDHGEELYDHGFWEHGFTLHEESVHVPLIIRPPGGLAKGRRVDHVVGLVDLLPTLVGLGGGDPPEGIEGKDLSPLLDGKESGGSEIVLSTAVRNNPSMVSLTAGPYRMIVDASSGKTALYDVIEDPHERNNLVGKRPEVLAEMRAYLGEVAKEGRNKHLFEPSEAPMTKERRELLKSLGYLN